MVLLGTSTSTVSVVAPAPDLVDRMRRLSVGSDVSETFSVISSAPSVRSLESVAGGVIVSHESNVSEATHHIDTTPLPTKTRPARPTAKAAASTPAVEEARPVPLSAPISKPLCSPFWFQFPGFTPNPTSTFKNEFSRLAKHQEWDNKTREGQKVAALMSEVNFFYGTCMNRLESWKELCEEVGIETIPTSITQCKKVRVFSHYQK